MKKLLNKLANATVLDFEQAGSMPSEIYFSKEIHDLEIEKIFKTEWICIGRTAEIPARGDYLTFNLLDQSVIAIRQKDESIKVFANVCAHRCARLLEDCGNTARIVCPYHAWSYQTDGKLIAAPYMDKTAGFDLKDYQLKEVRWEIWQGYIYITLNKEAESVVNRLSGFEEVIGRYQIENYVHAFTYDAIWPANWKCFVENYLDAYHIFKVHKDTFGKYGSVADVTTLYDGDNNFTYHLVDIGSKTQFTTDSAIGVAHPDNKHLDEFWRSQTVWSYIMTFSLGSTPRSLVKYNDQSISAITEVGSGVATDDMVLIKEQTASASATISFVDGTSDVVLDNTYPIYLFKFIGIHPQTDDEHLMFQGNFANKSWNLLEVWKS